MIRRICLALAGLVLLAAGTAGVAAAAAVAPREIEVVVGRRGFAPKTLEVAAGESVALTFVYGDTDLDAPNPHIIKLEGYGLQTGELSPENPRRTLTFTANKTGSFNMACVAKCEGHKQLQDGVIKVTGGVPSAQPSALRLEILPRGQGEPGYRLVAVLKDGGGNPVPGAVIAFTRQASFLPGQPAGPAKLGAATTGADGRAAITWVPRQAGDQQFGAAFAGTSTLLKAEAVATLQVSPAAVQEYQLESRRLDLGVGNWPLWVILVVVWGLYGFVIYQLIRIRLAATGLPVSAAAPLSPTAGRAPAVAGTWRMAIALAAGVGVLGLLLALGTNLGPNRALSSPAVASRDEGEPHERLLNAAADLARHESILSARMEQLAREVTTLAELGTQLAREVKDVATQVQAAQAATERLGERLGALDRQVAALGRTREAAAGGAAAGTATAAGNVAADGVFTVQIEAYAFGWDPQTVVVPLGKKVRLVVHNNQDRSLPGLVRSGQPLLEHGLGIEAYGIDVTVRPGETQVVEFMADKAGEFPIECTVWCGTGKLPDGSRAGHATMTAMLIVR